MKKYALLLSLVLLTAYSVFAQQHLLKGRVTASDNGNPLPHVTIRMLGSSLGTVSGNDGYYQLALQKDTTITLEVAFIGFQTKTIKIRKGQTKADITLDPSREVLQEVVVTGYASQHKRSTAYSCVTVTKAQLREYYPAPRQADTEDYSPVNENIFHKVTDRPLSTFSVDVDRASYSNVRRFLNSGQLPPEDAIRVEEMINYFDYKYQNPTDGAPVAIYTDMAICPWNKSNQLVRIALKGKSVTTDKLPASNLVFLIDVSGSMESANKLPLVKQAFKALVQQLRPADHVSIVVYAGAAGLVLPSTAGNEKTTILDALDKLEAGGSTAGGAGIQLAYRTAAEHFIKSGNNRVILATDGDFNVGASSDGELQRIIEKEKEKGIFLSVLGFGMGNYKDNKLELLADKGNGNYAYIDNFEEARRTFVTEFGGTLFTIAKDVKLQIEFNPRFVSSYRLVGYENRLLHDEDFNDDKKDAGDMGAGHTVTALYEIVPTNKARRIDNAPVDL
ncbi:VWA domain-containing protein [Chitinophaga sp. MD30]|uniref:vWA domain-containing protein n=1 Tax=Chitinophaga sp. MD30 TaxID=2033437 RepID=UPI002101B98A|nr:von Willebrand factor type A domain-containing protein [Chitinophaga sp. MD30]